MDADDLLRVEQGAQRLRVSMRAVAAALDPARRTVIDFLAPLGLAASTLFDIELVLEEILTNVIRHGLARHEDLQRIELETLVRPDAIVLRFDYGGVAFNPRTAPEPRAYSSLEDTVPGGLGLKLVRRRVGAFEYAWRGGRNELTLEVPRAPRSSATA